MSLNAESISTDICPICCSEIIESPVYPAALQEEINLERMVLETKVNRVCQHIFCRDCLTSWINIEGNLHTCPYCFTIYTELLAIDAKIINLSERFLKDLDGVRLVQIATKLLEKKQFNKALEITRLIPASETTKFPGGGSVISDYVDQKNRIFLQLLTTYKKQKKFIKVLEILDKDLDLSESKNKPSDVAFLLQVSEIYAEFQKTDQAFEILDRALKNMDRKDCTGYYLVLLSLNVSDYYRKIGKLDQGLKYLNKAFTETKSISNGLDRVTALTDISKRYVEMKKPDEALTILNQALEIAGSILGDDYDKQQSFIKIFSVYLKAEKLDQALETFGKALAADPVFQTEDEKSFVVTFNDYIEAGKSNEAFKFLKNSLELVESILDIEEDSEVKALLSKMIENGFALFSVGNKSFLQC